MVTKHMNGRRNMIIAYVGISNLKSISGSVGIQEVVKTSRNATSEISIAESWEI